MNKSLLVTIGAVSALFILLVIVGGDAPIEPESGAVDSAGDQASVLSDGETDADRERELKLTRSQLLHGRWITARMGGEDGLTDCDQAMVNEHFINREGNKVGLINIMPEGAWRQVHANETVDNLTVMDGTYEFDGEILDMIVAIARTGRLQDDLDSLREDAVLHGQEMQLAIEFIDNNVITMTNPETKVGNRWVRCRPEPGT